VFTGSSGSVNVVEVVLQSVVPLSGPRSGVPITAACHSAFDGSRLRAFSHAACAWNHVMFADGSTAGSKSD
jgi:hypothetical protein